MASVEDILRSVPLFEGLSRREISRVMKETQKQSFSPAKSIVSEGDSGGRFFVILDGLANVTVNGRKKATLSRGDFFGEMSVIDKGPRSATVTTETQVTTLSLASWSLLALLEENFSMARKVMQGLCQRIRSEQKSVLH